MIHSIHSMQFASISLIQCAERVLTNAININQSRDVTKSICRIAINRVCWHENSRFGLFALRFVACCVHLAIAHFASFNPITSSCEHAQDRYWIGNQTMNNFVGMHMKRRWRAFNANNFWLAKMCNVCFYAQDTYNQIDERA